MPAKKSVFDPTAASTLQLFALLEAEHFCRAIPAGVAYKASSLKTYVGSLPGKDALIQEGTSDFDLLRAIMLAEAERSIFLSAANFRRAHDLMTTGSASWCLVTLYYSAFHSAKAILAMFGGFFDRDIGTVEVADGTHGKQSLVVFKKGRQRITTLTSSTRGGTHEMFWDVFYKAVVPLHQFVDRKFIDGLYPVFGNPKWLTSTRNDVNYSTYSALALSADFLGNFKPKEFPDSLPAKLNETYASAFNLMRGALFFADALKLSPDSLDSLAQYRNRSKSIRDHILAPKPLDFSRLGVRFT